MTAVALHDLDGAIFAAVTALGANPPTPTQPFAYVARWAGEFLGADDVAQRQSVLAYPCALVAALGGRAASDVLTLGWDAENVASEGWTIFVGCADPRGDGSAIPGDAAYPSTGQPGAMRLVDVVLAAVNQLLVPGLYQAGAVLCEGWGPHWIKRGVAYVYAVRFVAKRVLPGAAFPDASAPLEEIAGGLQLPSDPDAPAPTPIDLSTIP